jgi:O-Antigen ligase
MILTFVGVLQLVIGCFLLFAGRLSGMFVFLMVSGLIGGSAAIVVPALGNSSIPPIQFALLFIFLRLLMPKGGYFSVVKEAMSANMLLVLFTLYGVAAAIAAPRIFEGAINVAPLRFDNARSLFDTVPLEPTPQNITASIYLLGALMVSLAAYVVCRTPDGPKTLVKTGVFIAWAHAFSGLAGILGRGTFVEEVLELFRNGSYAQLDQTYQGFIRINGFFPEASGYAVFGLAWFIFNAECWYRSVMPRATGRATLILALTLFFSTSSTAYVGLACYAGFFMLRLLLVPNRVNGRRLTQAAIAAVAAFVMIAITMAAFPQFASAVADMLLHMTVEKGDSDSGQQRLFWAMQGWHAFVASWGVGIGPGSFRSSSLLTAILGSMGVIGIATFLGYVVVVFRPSRASTWGDAPDAATAIGAAAATTAFLILIPASISSPSSHPGTNFAIFAGAAMALRPLTRRMTQSFSPSFPTATEQVAS